MTEAEKLLEEARLAFRLASDATVAISVEYYAEMGRESLRLAHEAAKIVVRAVPKPSPSWWNFS